jgi:FHA domain
VSKGGVLPGLWPIHGDGVLARQGDLVLLIHPAGGTFADLLLDLLTDAAPAGQDGLGFTNLIAAEFDADAAAANMADPSPSVVAFGPDGAGGTAVALYGTAWVEVTTAHGMQRLSPGQPYGRIRAVLPSQLMTVRAGVFEGDDNADTDPYLRLADGIVRAVALAYAPEPTAPQAPPRHKRPQIRVTRPPAAAPESVASAPESVVPAAQNVTPAPESAGPAPESVVPESVASAPENVVPESAVLEPEGVAPANATLRPGNVLKESVTPPPESATPEPEIVVPEPENVAQDPPENVLPEPENLVLEPENVAQESVTPAPENVAEEVPAVSSDAKGGGFNWDFGPPPGPVHGGQPAENLAGPAPVHGGQPAENLAGPAPVHGGQPAENLAGPGPVHGGQPAENLAGPGPGPGPGGPVPPEPGRRSQRSPLDWDFGPPAPPAENLVAPGPVGPGPVGPGPGPVAPGPGTPQPPGPGGQPNPLAWDFISVQFGQGQVESEVPRRPPLPLGPEPPLEQNLGVAETRAPEVLGVYCKNGHFDDPEARYCAVCGISMAQLTKAPRKGKRPPLGVLVLDDGSVFQLDADYVIGREPSLDSSVADGSARPLRLTDAEGLVSRIHARVELDGWQVYISDLESANGTYVQLPGEPDGQLLTPRVRTPLIAGTHVRVGRDHGFRYDSHRHR